MTDNWYIVLELPFDPTPEHDERVIAKQIEEKRALWSRRFNDPTMGAAYHRYLDKIHDGTIAKDMIGPHNKRKQLIKEACEITYGPIDETLRLTGLGGKVTGDELQRIADHHGTSVDIVRRQALALGIKIREGEQENYQALYAKYYSQKPDNTVVFDQMGQYLASFSVDNLYAFWVHPKLWGRDKWKLLLSCSVLHSIADNYFATSLYDPRTDKYVTGSKGAAIHAIYSLPQKL